MRRKTDAVRCGAGGHMRCRFRLYAGAAVIPTLLSHLSVAIMPDKRKRGAEGKLLLFSI